MGLDIDIDGFDLWHGGYNGFRTLRNVIKKTYYSMPEKDRLDGCGILDEFLHHSDCDGELSWAMCDVLSQILYSIVPYLTEEESWGHIERQGGIVKCVERLAKGFHLAYEQKEDPQFH